jgi:hypothetical protein
MQLEVETATLPAMYTLIFVPAHLNAPANVKQQPEVETVTLHAKIMLTSARPAHQGVRRTAKKLSGLGTVTLPVMHMLTSVVCVNKCMKTCLSTSPHLHHHRPHHHLLHLHNVLVSVSKLQGVETVTLLVMPLLTSAPLAYLSAPANVKLQPEVETAILPAKPLQTFARPAHQDAQQNVKLPLVVGTVFLSAMPMPTYVECVSSLYTNRLLLHPQPLPLPTSLLLGGTLSGTARVSLTARRCLLGLSSIGDQQLDQPAEGVAGWVSWLEPREDPS